MHSERETKTATKQQERPSLVYTLAAGIELIGGIASHRQLSSFVKQLGLNSKHSPQRNAELVADSIYARMDSPETPGREWARGPTLRRREPMQRPDELPDLDEDLIDLLTDTSGLKTRLQGVCIRWVEGVEDVELENASRLRMLIFACELYVFADPTLERLGDRWQAVGEFAMRHYRIDVGRPPREYSESIGPWRLARHTRRYDVVSRSVRLREMQRPASAPVW